MISDKMNFEVSEECFQAVAKLDDQKIDFQVLKNDNIPLKTNRFCVAVKE